MSNRPGREPRISGRQAAAAALAATMVVSILVLFFPRGYEVNDDVAIVHFLRANTLAPFISPALSQTLGAAYAHVSVDIAWFGYYLYAVATLSLGSLLALGIVLYGQQPGRSRRTVAVGVAVMTILAASNIAIVTFTRISILAGTVALLGLVIITWEPADASVRQRRWLLVLGVLFALSYTTRTHGVLAAVSTVGLLLLVWAIRGFRNSKRNFFRSVAVFLVPIALTLLADRMAPQYHDPQAQAYSAFNLARGAVNEVARFASLDRRAPEKLRGAGWSTDRYLELWNWVFLDDEFFTTTNLERLHAAATQPTRGIGDFVVTTGHALRSGGRMFWVFVATLLGTTTFALTRLRERWRLLFFVLASGAYVVALCGSMEALARFPTRIAEPIFAGSTIVLAVFLSLTRWPSRVPASLWPERLIQIAACLVAVAVFVVDSRAHAPRVRTASAATRAVQDWKRQRPNAFLVVYGGGGFEGFDPLDPAPRSYEDLGLGWTIFSVPFARALKARGIDRAGQLFPWMLNNADAFVITSQVQARWLERYLRAKLGAKDLALERAPGSPALGSVSIYRIVTARSLSLRRP